MIITIKQYSGRLIRLSIFLVALPFLIWGGMGLSASLFAAAPQTAMMRWECTGKIDDHGRWQTYLSNLQTALKLDPLNVDTLRSLAKMHEWKTVGHAPWNKALDSSRQQAIEYYRQVVLNRPVWALGWAELANMKIRSMELDGEALAALNKALNLGRWQRDVQNKAIWLAVGVWDSMPAYIRVQVKRNLKMLLHREIDLTAAILMSIRFGWEDELESILTRQADLALLDEFRNNGKKTRYLWERMGRNKAAHCAHVV